MAPQKKLTKGVRSALGCTGLFILLAALALLQYMFLGSFVSYVRSLQWPETPCVILESGIRGTNESSSSSTGRRGEPTYRPHYVYNYDVNGTTYRSDRYSFFVLTFDTAARATREAAQHPVGSQAICYVNPADPAEAVFNREFRWFQLIGLVFPLAFVAMGVVSLFLAIPGPASLKGGAPGSLSLPVEHGGVLGGGAVTLRATSSRLGNLVSATVFTLVWNGFLAAVAYLPTRDYWDSDGASLIGFVRQTAAEIGRSPDAWFGLLCVSPFVLIGVLLLANIPYQVLALFNPWPRLTLSQASIPAGGSARLQWRLPEIAGRVRRLTIVLYAHRLSVHQSAPNRLKPAMELPLVDVDRSGGLQEGTVTVTIPEDAHASSDSGTERVAWKLKVVGEIFLWPDVEAEFPITITRRG